MLRGLHHVEGANACLPFVRLFYSQPSQYVWHDETNKAHITRRRPPNARFIFTWATSPYAGRVFTTIPYGPESTYSSEHFRLLILRRLRLPLPLSARTCRCRRTLDPLGDHRSACAQSGLLRRRGRPRICFEAGARVTTNTRVADLNISSVHCFDDRRIEVIANGLPLWGGCHLAVDTTSSPAFPGGTTSPA